MKSIITSVSPYLCEKIASDDCKILVKKSTPKEVPFKAYIYCCKAKSQGRYSNYEGAYENSKGEIVYAQQHIIGEFICDKVYNIDYLPKECEGNPSQFSEFICNNSCLSFEQIMEYKKGKTIYGWHITDLKLYDKPKELNEFCCHDNTYDNAFGWAFEDRAKSAPLTRPPQSWQYVEEIETR